MKKLLPLASPLLALCMATSSNATPFHNDQTSPPSKPTHIAQEKSANNTGDTQTKMQAFLETHKPSNPDAYHPSEEE